MAEERLAPGYEQLQRALSACQEERDAAGVEADEQRRERQAAETARDEAEAQVRRMQGDLMLAHRRAVERDEAVKELGDANRRTESERERADHNLRLWDEAVKRKKATREWANQRTREEADHADRQTKKLQEAQEREKALREALENALAADTEAETRHIIYAALDQSGKGAR